MGETICPRCRQVVKVGPINGKIKPHRDALLNVPCMLSNKTEREAEVMVARARQKAGLPQ